MINAAKEKVNKSAPWFIFYEKMQAMFGEDPAIDVSINDERKEVKLYVVGTDKCDAISQLLPPEKVFGNITVKISVIPANEEDPSMAELYERALEGNPAFIFTAEGKRGETTTIPFTYVAFDESIVQYYADNLEDYYGNDNTLYQEIAKDIFIEHPGVKFCTRSKVQLTPTYGHYFPNVD